jgi:hypothetical protein
MGVVALPAKSPLYLRRSFTLFYAKTAPQVLRALKQTQPHCARWRKA